MSNFGNEWIVVEVNNQYFGLSARCVLELLDQTGLRIVSFPGCKPPLIGMLEHRGAVLPVIDTRLVLNFPTFKEELEDLRTMLDAREQDHTDWLNELRSACLTGTEFTKETNPKKCAFGKWYQSILGSEDKLRAISGGDPSIESVFKAFEAPHHAIHAIAGEALDHARSGNTEAAVELIQRTWDTELSKMKNLFDRLHKAVEQNRRPRLAIAQAGDQSAAFVVDGVQTMIIIDEADIQPVSTGVTSSADIFGIYPSERFGEVILIDGVGVINKLEGIPTQMPNEAQAA